MTDIYVMNKNFEDVAVIDTFDSFIWTNRYNRPGDFELALAKTPEHRAALKADYYLRIAGEPNVMIVETIEPDTDSDTNFVVRGRDLSSIIDRRVTQYAWYTGSIQTAILEMLKWSIVQPSNTYRTISNFRYETSTDSSLTGLTMSGNIEFIGKNVLEQINAWADEYKFGYRTYLDSNNNFVFRLYIGDNRSYNQTVNPFVVFSPEFDNIKSTQYLEDYSKWKNVVLISGEGDASNTTLTWLGLDAPSGLYRREFHYSSDKTSVTGQDEDGEDIHMSVQDYDYILKNDARPELYKQTVTKIYDGEVDLTRLYAYNVDFSVGDIVQFVTDDGEEFRCRIVEFTRSWDESGFEAYPVFEVEKEQ